MHAKTDLREANLTIDKAIEKARQADAPPIAVVVLAQLLDQALEGLALIELRERRPQLVDALLRRAGP